MYNRNKLKYTDERKRKPKEPTQLNSCTTKYLNAMPEETMKGRNEIMNKFDLEFLNGYIKSSLRLARTIKRRFKKNVGTLGYFPVQSTQI